MRSSFFPLGSRRGGVTPLTVLCLALLLGTIALVVDGGTLMEDRRHVQAAADASALAAAADLFAHYSSNQGSDPGGSAAASALATAAANGYGNDGEQSIVTVNLSPAKYQAGANAGKPLPPGYAEVIVQYNAGRMFSNIFGSGAIPIYGRAVARGQWLPVSTSVMALNPSAPNTLGVFGNGGLRINGGVQVNSNSSQALGLGGNAVLNASHINLNQNSGNRLFSFLQSYFQSLGGTQPSVSSTGAVADPLRFLPPPDPVQLGLTPQGTNLQISNGTKDLNPGVYTGGISVSGSGTVILHANPDGSPGIYYLQGGGFTTSSSASVVMASNATAGVMIYNDWLSGSGALHFIGSGPLVLTPPTSGPYQGVTLFQARGTPSTSGPLVLISGQGQVKVTGTIYAAYAAVFLSGLSGTNVMGGQVIADSIHVTGNASVTVDPLGGPSPNTRTLGLVE